MGLITGLDYIVPFLVILTALVFVHELGHYLIARHNGVRVEVFSIGFGPELFGWTARNGTRWKFSAIPLGGYVKMFGDADPTSLSTEGLERLTPAEREVSFYYKPLAQRTAVVAAGPIANFVFAVLLFAGIFATLGQPLTPPDVGRVQPGSAAEQGGIQAGDVILSIEGSPIRSFEEIKRAVSLNAGTPMTLVLRRGESEVTLTVTPRMTALTDRFGNKHEIALLGIERTGETEYAHPDPATAVWRAVEETADVTTGTLQAVWQMVIGVRGTEEVGGPLRIAQMSGEMAQGGVFAVLWFMAVLSVNLGLINLFPIPVLDGGHLLFYAAEAVRGRPLGQRAQEYGFRVGLALVLTLMVFATWNDLVHLRVVEFIKGLVT